MCPAKWPLLVWVVLASGTCQIVRAQLPPPAPTGEQRIETAGHGMQLLMDGDFDKAIEVFRQIAQAEPESPLGYVLEADSNWWRIYLTEGNLIDPDVFEAVSEAVTPYDADFQRLNNLAIQKAEAQIHSHKDEARAHLYEGFAYALAARLEALRDHALATAGPARKCATCRSPPLNWILRFTTLTWEPASTTTSRPRCRPT